MKLEIFLLILYSLTDTGMESPRKTPSSGPSRQSVSRMTSSSHLELVFPNYTENMKGMFAYAFVWSFGAHLHERFVIVTSCPPFALLI